MKLNKLFLGLFGLAALTLASCSDDDKYEWATVSGPQVYFTDNLQTQFEIDPEGELVTPLVCGSSACAFAHFDDSGACLCAIEKCGCTKPESCSLYPIRVKRFKGGGMALNLHKWSICAAAFEKGRREGVRVYQFLRGPLTEAFGEEFYEALCAAAEHVIAAQQDLT